MDNIEELKNILSKITDSQFLEVIKNIDNDRVISNPYCHSNMLLQYIRICQQVYDFVNNGRGHATIDDPLLYYDRHYVTITIDDDDFDEEPLHELCDILAQFHGMYLGQEIASGKCQFFLEFDGIYSEFEQ